MGGSVGKPPKSAIVSASTPQAPPKICSQVELQIAIGIVSAPRFVARRMAQRESWLQWPEVGQEKARAICATFVVRAGNAPEKLQLSRESSAQRDMLLVESIPWNETRVRGPVLTLAWWLKYVSINLSHARFVGKVDDDTYIHVPDLIRLLKVTELSFGTSTNIYFGALSFCHWYEKLFDLTQHALTHKGAINVGRWCREKASPPCLGPFPSAAGFLMVLSSHLAAELNSHLHADVDRLLGLNPALMRNKRGGRLELIYEDAWLASVLHRSLPRLARRVHYVSLPVREPRLYLELTWAFRMARTVLLTHLRSKKSEHYIATHAFAQRLHCSRNFQLRCSKFGDNGDKWCTVALGSSTANKSGSTGCCFDSMGSSSSSTCALGGGSDGGVFGSDRWAAPFQAAAQQSFSRRFARAAKHNNLSQLPRQAISALAAEARSAWYTRQAESIRPRV